MEWIHMEYEQMRGSSITIIINNNAIICHHSKTLER